VPAEHALNHIVLRKAAPSFDARQWRTGRRIAMKGFLMLTPRTCRRGAAFVLEGAHPHLFKPRRSRPMIVRAAKALLTCVIGIFALLVGADNVIDYGTNFAFVRHVMSMDTTFPGNKLMWRAITSEWAHHAAYAAIIAAELAAGALTTAGALRLFQARHAPAREFNAAKDAAIGGLALGFALFFFGFIVVGGEWFQMWQSQTWNGQEAAFRFAACIGLVLIFVAIEDGEHGHDSRL
jgi:predicted small integral membrane protein